MIEKRKNNIILFCITLLGSLAMLGAIRAIVEDKKDSDYKSYHQKIYEEYKQQRDSSYQHLTQIYGKEKVGLVIYSCICFENENINLDSLQMGYISDVYFKFDDVQDILQGKIKIGFNFLQCIEALGYPEDTDITVTAENRYADWYYDNGYTLHLINGYLTRYSIR